MVYLQCISLSLLLLYFITANAVLFAEADPGASQSQRHGQGAAVAAPRSTGQGPAKRSLGHAFSKVAAAPKPGKEVGEARKKRCEDGGCDDGGDGGDGGGGGDYGGGDAGGGIDSYDGAGNVRGGGGGGGITCQCTCDGLPIDADAGSGARGR